MKKLKNGPKKLPVFKNADEETRFFEEHDAARYWDQLEEADVVIEADPELARRIRDRFRKRLMAIRLEQWQIIRAKEIAKRKGVPYQRLMREWISQGIRQENTPTRHRKA